MAYTNHKGSVNLSNLIKGLDGILRIAVIISFLIVLVSSASAQVGNGTSSPERKDTSNNADQNLKSIAHINPSTLAMEMSLPLMSYPGRNGNSLPVGFSYSSKVWRMNPTMTWSYHHQVSGVKQYVTDIYTRYSERTAAGWTSNLLPPRIDQTLQIYDENGQPWSRSVDEAGLNEIWQNTLSSFIQQNLMSDWFTCNSYNCAYGTTNTNGPGWYCVCNSWRYTGGGGGPTGGGPTGGGPTGGGTPPPTQLYYVKRLEISMGDGSNHEFRASDAPIHCGTSNTGCPTDMDGTYLSVDGSGMRLEKTSTGITTLFMPNGSRYNFPAVSPNPTEGNYATEYIDPDGNKLTFSSEPDPITGIAINKWIDTLGREIIDPIPYNIRRQSTSTKEISLPGLNGANQTYKMKWSLLKPRGCENDTTGNCVGSLNTTGGALEDQIQKLYYDAKYNCRGNISENLNDLSNGEVLFSVQEPGVRPCNAFNVQTNEAGEPILDSNNNVIPTAPRFNPAVLTEVELPNHKKYIFKYNRYGEISKIIYPTGSYETFVYNKIPPINGGNSEVYDQTNRGVTERRVYSANDVMEQRWQYIAEVGKITIKAPKKDDPFGVGMITKRYVGAEWSDGSNYGFSSPGAGLPLEERSYDELGNLRSRTLTEYITKNGANAGRDARVKRTVSVAIDNGLALASLSENEYDETGSTDPEYFSHLNLKRLKGYHFAVIPLSLAKNDSEQPTQTNLAAIAGYFNSSLLASVSETDYLYGAGGTTGFAYKQRGIHGLPIESRVLNPSNNQVIAKTQTVFDETAYLVSDSGALSGNLAATWVDPGTTLRGKPTTSKLWDSDNNVWIQTHTQYDQYGNVRKAWDASGDPSRFTVTEYSADYGFAYPTKVITPAPDPTGTHGTNQGSFATTTYDFMTGLPLTSTNEFNQTTKTEYADALLRPTRVSGVGTFVIPVTETVYDDTALTVKVRKQIDTNNWDEAISYSDSLGRTVLTQAKDSQGDVFTETKYDFLGRVKRTTNPYRLNDTNNPKLWSRPRYDAVGRVYETCGPVTESLLPSDSATDQNPPCPTGASLGITQYGISTQAGFIGTFVLTTDAAGKQSRALSNALGQLVRVDEPDHLGAITPLPQSTPNPSPSPTPSGTPRGGGGGGQTGCAIGTPSCLTAADYPMNSTYYYYNAQGKMVEVIQGDQHRYFKYDSLGRLIRVRQPEQTVNANLDKADTATGNNQWTAAFSYDLLGNVITATDANGTVITNAYDKANRVVTKTYANEPNGQTTPAVEYFYDGKGLSSPQSPNFAKGKLTKVTSSVSETLYTNFDELGRLLRMEQRTPVTGETIATAIPRVSSYQYNFAGALVQETYPSGRVVKNEFEADGDLSRIYGQANANSPERTYANGFSYTADGKIQRLRLGNGRWESAKFNERLQVTELALGTSNGDGSLWKLQYEYGEFENGSVNQAKNTGNIARQTVSFTGLTNPLVQTYKYDSLYRLTEARETNGTSTNAPQTWKENFSYDRYGNRLSHDKFVGVTQLTLDNKTHPTINPANNRFNDNQGYIYDKNGNLTDDAEGRTFIFNGENKQRFVVKNNANVGEYFYDGEGKRVKKKVYNTDGINVKEETVFVYSAGKLVAEYSTKSPPSNPTTSYTATDQLGSPRVITDSNGQVISRRDFMPFGEEAISNIGERPTTLKYGTTDSVRQKFTGYQKDEETNLDFAEARMYENRHGRFTAVDPLLASGKSANPQTFNRFVYTSNNPISRVDINGKDWIVITTMTKKEIKDRSGKIIKTETITIKTPEWVEKAKPEDELASNVWQVNIGDKKGFQALHPTTNESSELFATKEEAQAKYNEWLNCSSQDFI
jgi:RHS repeat-associated protein